MKVQTKRRCEIQEQMELTYKYSANKLQGDVQKGSTFIKTVLRGSKLNVLKKVEWRLQTKE